MVLAHLAEDSDVGAVLDEVVSDHGSNMILRSIGSKSNLYLESLVHLICQSLISSISNNGFQG